MKHLTGSRHAFRVFQRGFVVMLPLVGACSGSNQATIRSDSGGTTGTGGLTGTGGATLVGGDTAGSTAAGGTASTGGTNTVGTTDTGGASTGGLSNGGNAASSEGTGGSATGACGAGDANLPAEPTIPTACQTLQATQNVVGGAEPSENSLDTSTIQSALSACASGQAVKLTTGGSNNAFVTGPLTIPTGVTLWVNAGTTLYGTRNPSVYGSATALITARGSNSGIVGDGVIDGQGGEPIIGGSGSFWDQNGSGGSSPALIQTTAAIHFTLYKITLYNSPMFHAKLNAAGFVVWGVTIKTPSKSTNSAGTALTPSSAHNTDGVDPGQAASNGYVVCSNISVGDDHIAIKGGTSVHDLVIAHNHFGSGHGMSIGSETNGGVSNVNVYDLSIDGQNSGMSGGSSNGIRIKSDSSRGGLVNNITYSDVCVRYLSNPIIMTPYYSTATGALIPHYTNIMIQNFHAFNGPSGQKVTLDGYSSSYVNSVTLDNVIVDGISDSSVATSYTNVTLGPGNVNFTPSGTGVTVTNSISGSSQPNPCTGKWVTL